MNEDEQHEPDNSQREAVFVLVFGLLVFAMAAAAIVTVAAQKILEAGG